MAIRNVVTRGYGAGASIAFVVTRGYSIGVPPPVAAVANAPKSILFISASAGMLFSAAQLVQKLLQEDGFFILKEDSGNLLTEQGSVVQSNVEFSSASQSMAIEAAPPVGRLLQEDGFFILKEDGENLLKEQE